MTLSSKAPASRMTGGERRAQLLDAARNAFAQDGFHATSMDDIADAAGITKPVVYQHLASKHDLYMEVLGEMRDRLIDAIDDVDINASPADRLRQGVQAYFDFVANHEASFRLMFEAALADADVNRLVQGVREHIAERAARVLAALGGRMAYTDPSVVAWAIVGMCEMVSHWWLDHPTSRGTADELAEQVSLLAWSGVSAASSGT